MKKEKIDMQTADLLIELQKKDKFDLSYIIQQLLINKKINYVEISNAYMGYLEYQNKKNRTVINGLAIPLSAYLDNRISKSQKKFIEAKSAYNLIQAEMFTYTPYANNLQKYVDEAGYSEDENGHHIITN
jgi:uncharacterized protein with beta-barrel porin domain